METYQDYGIDVSPRSSGQTKTICPRCSQTRTNKRDKSLSVNFDKGIWNCHYCGWSGHLKNETKNPYHVKQPAKYYTRPKPRNTTALSDKLVQWFGGRGISQSTLDQMRIAEGMEVMPQTGKSMNTLQFTYWHNDELVNVKYRTGNKYFKMESGAELIPYNIDAILGAKECIVTEGEMDCLSFVECGLTNCISVPAGANSNLSFLDNFIDDYFEDKEIIYIASDTDEKGCLLRDELVRRFGQERCRIVTYGDECKDANEHLVKYGKESLKQCISNAWEFPVDGVYTVSDYEQDLDNVYMHGLPKGMTIGHPNFDKLMTLETQRLCVVTGIPGSGKSEFIDEICVRLNLRYGHKVAYFSPENMPFSYHATKVIEKLVGKSLTRRDMPLHEYNMAKEYMQDNFFHILPTQGYTLDNILNKASYLVRRRGIRILVIDPYNRVENEQPTTLSETQHISRILDRLTNFAQQHDVLVCLMAHPKKMTNEDGKTAVPTMYDINGSANFFNKADYGIIVHRYRDYNYTLVRVAKVKFRQRGELGDCHFKYDSRNGRYIPYDLDSPPPPFDYTNYLVTRLNDDISQQQQTFNLDFLCEDSTPPPF